MYDGGISIETYSEGAGRDVASMVDYEQVSNRRALLCYPYILPRKVQSHGRFIPRFCYLNFMKRKSIF